MSAETNFLQRFITLKFQMDNDARFRPEATRRAALVDLGIEITVAEANPCTVIFDGFTEIPSLAPGQKAYARSVAGTGARTCKLVDAEVGLRFGTGGLEPVIMHAGLDFPNVSADSVERHFAYPRTGDPNNWYNLRPFGGGGDVDRFANVTVSLIPFRTSGRLSPVPVAPDDQVHVRATLRDGHDDGVTLTNVHLDPTTQQLVGSGPSMARQDQSSLWLISFFIVPGPPV
jgi:hypothetical protein